MTDTDATRLAGGSIDATRLAGDAYRTRLVRSEADLADDKTRLAQEGYQSRLARDVVGEEADTGESYALGERIGGRYEVSAIHHGELGVVYGCFDHETKQPRALKTVRARHVRDEQVLSLFESEATVWVSLEKHPYIVRAYRVERFKSFPYVFPYVVTEYVCGPEGMGGDLRGWQGHPRLTLPVAVTMALQIAQGMQHAVRKVPNLVHRDLKPANILVNSEGKAMITDFGLVHAGQSGAGTPAYMSPEQWQDKNLDSRSDIYAYGCILFEMFTGHRLFPALTEREWERAHLTSTPAELTSLVPQLPGEIDRFVRRCLEKNRSERPQSWDEVVTFFAEWYHRLTGKAVVYDFSSLALNDSELFDAGYSLGNLKRYEEAIQAYDRVLAIDPNNSSAWNNKGCALNSLDRYEEAIQAYDRALAIDPNFILAGNNKSYALDALRHYEEAIKDFDLALAIAPNDPMAWYNKGKALDDLKHYKEAIQAFDRALAIDPNCVLGWNSKGEALSNLKRYEDAIQAYDRALEIDPNNSGAWLNKTSALESLKRYEEAIQAYDRMLNIDFDDSLTWLYSLAWSGKGSALLELKRYGEADQAFDRALAIDPDDLLVWVCKGNLLRDTKHHEEAILAYKRLLSILPSHFTFLWNMIGSELLNLRRYEEAIQAFDLVLGKDTTDEFALLRKKRAVNALKAAR